MIKITRFFYIHWLVFPLFALSFFAGGLYTLLGAYAVVSVHELFHLFAALCTGERVGALVLQPFGMSLRLSAAIIRHPQKEIFIALAGPFSNVLMLLLCPHLAVCYGNSLALTVFRFLNWGTLLLNLLPCLPLDGGRVLRALLVKHMGYIGAASLMRKISRIVIWILLILGTLLLFFTRLNVSLLMAGGFLAQHLAQEKKQDEYMIMQSLLHHKEKLQKRGLMPTRTVCALGDVSVRRVFRMLSYDCYYLIVIVNKKQEPLHLMTEAQLVDAITKKGWHISLQDVCRPFLIYSSVVCSACVAEASVCSVSATDSA